MGLVRVGEEQKIKHTKSMSMLMNFKNTEKCDCWQQMRLCMITGLCQQLNQVIPVVVLIKQLIKPFEQYDHLKTDGICTTVNYIIQIHSKRRKLAVFVSKCLVQRVSVLLILIKKNSTDSSWPIKCADNTQLKTLKHEVSEVDFVNMKQTVMHLQVQISMYCICKTYHTWL